MPFLERAMEEQKFNRLAQWMTNYEHCNLHMFEVVLLHTPQAFY